MAIPNLATTGRLHGVKIFLSASIPSLERRDEYERIHEAPIRIEEAVVCIARAIFMEGGTLVFGAHPSISPLIARVVDHYYLPEPAEHLDQPRLGKLQQKQWQNPSVVIYQSLVWKKQWAKTTQQLSRHPLVEVVWTKTARGEKVDPEVTNQPQAPRSMERMRKTMIENTSPAAMIAVGGMKGVSDEAHIFATLRPESPIFTLATTGGSAALLTKQKSLAGKVHVMDREAESLVSSFWRKQETRHDRVNEASERSFYVPYALVAQQIVASLLQNRGDVAS